ncbi:M15 family metallopeptidase [uncultured Nocardioides sp.]|uniref:M15 family metallopeptidase n=1 Tax=uncultured Nocardioides sp. TaxID=198441 RepID=UPI00261F6477|nr:M15 family metallopeptidase [uncultured Nocardioides sp.]
MRLRRGTVAGVALVACATLLAGCGDGASSTGDDTSQGAEPGTGAGSDAAPDPDADPDADPGETEPAEGTTERPAIDPAMAVEDPGPLDGRLFGDDLLVYAPDTLADDVVEGVAGLDGVERVEQFALAPVAVEDTVVDVAAVDPSSYRNFNPIQTAQFQEVWDRVAGGELGILPGLGRRMEDENGFVRLGNDRDAPQVHIGAYAPQVRQIDAVLNENWIEPLGMRPGNALLVNTGTAAPQDVRDDIKEIVGEGVPVQILGPDLDITATQTAFLTGGSVAEAVGTFTYEVIGGGRIAPDPAWEAANIRTEEVPILGDVTCHKVMLPQLRAAFTEVVTRGLADEINPDEYAGCYYPRFIAGSSSLSLHSFGIAVDLNVPGNQRGTVGDIDRDVVAIMKKWGFAWGGDWSFTDPMHFEMDRLVQAR